MCELLDMLENRGLERGLERGKLEGTEFGIEKGLQLSNALLKSGRVNDLERALSDIEYRKQLCDELNIS